MKDRRQQGLSLIGFIFVSVILVFAVIAVVKVVPALTEYWNIRKIMAAMAQSGELSTASPADIRKSFDRRAVIDNVTAIEGKDLVLQKVNNEYQLSFKYEHRVHLFSNVYLLFDFDGGTAGGTTPTARRAF